MICQGGGEAGRRERRLGVAASPFLAEITPLLGFVNDFPKTQCSSITERAPSRLYVWRGRVASRPYDSLMWM